MSMATMFKLTDLITGASIAPPNTIISATDITEPNPAYVKWLLRDKKLFGVPFTTLEPKAMVDVLECSSSQSAWLALEATFANAYTSRVNQLRQQLLPL